MRAIVVSLALAVSACAPFDATPDVGMTSAASDASMSTAASRIESQP